MKSSIKQEKTAYLDVASTVGENIRNAKTAFTLNLNRFNQSAEIKNA